MSKQESAFYDSLLWGLLSAREPKVVSGLAEYEKLSQVIKAGQSKQVRSFLQKRADRVASYWMRTLGSKRGRPVDLETRKAYAAAEYGDRLGIKRTQLIPLIDSGGRPDAARDRLRKGIARVRKEKQFAREHKRKPQ